MMPKQTRREWLASTAAGLAGIYVSKTAPLMGAVSPAPTAPVSIVKCRSYLKAELLPAMSTMFDQIGGLDRLVKGKTVGIKINLTGNPGFRLGYLPAGDTH